jgi:broad specificity phosphatase PhoE
MPHLVLVRHAQSAWNALGRWQGWADPPLSAQGRQQAAVAGDRLRATGVTPALVISSDLRRAAESAAGVAAGACGEAEQATDARWREFRVGAWSGLTRTEIEQRWPGALARYDAGDLTAAPGSEPPEEFAGRLAGALEAAARRTPATGVCLVVTHGGAIRAVARLLGYSLERVGNLSGLLVEATTNGAAGDGRAVPRLAARRPVDLLDPRTPGIIP